MKLIATFKLKLAHYFLMNGSIEDIRFSIDIGDYQTEVTLIPYSKGSSIKCPSEKDPTYCISDLIILVSRIEESPPPSQFTADGTRDDITFVKYFDDRLPKYRNIAETLTRRLIRYFKYKLRNPLLMERNIDISGLNNPVWTNESGQEYEPVRRCFVIESTPGLQSGYLYSSGRLSFFNDFVISCKSLFLKGRDPYK